MANGTLYRDLKSYKKKYFFCLKKVYFLYFWSKSIDFIDFRVDRSWYKLCFRVQIILSTYTNTECPTRASL